MNELQKIEFELFLCFDEICKKLNIEYFLVAGSALGAVRHGGFIPWDDDFDVGMYREDYNKFIEYAPKFLPEGIFLQNYRTDAEFPYVFSKLRNSNTTFIENFLSKFDINHGIFMDIFPLDGFPDNKRKQKMLMFKRKNLLRKVQCAFDYKRGFKANILAKTLRFLGYHKRTAKTLAQYESLISRYDVECSKIICNHGNRYGKRDHMPKEYYGSGTYVMFEGVLVRIPEKYDEYLKSLYDDWHNLPPIEERKDIHPCGICDTKKPYTEYSNCFGKKE